ncbi:hypothetical protein SAMN05444004_1313 [Jannaschia faecimaris]|uniref:Uncharacterized protein n=1 Tax=Jannaschia faecimaris TaxID=1244108 RepID=A0A1H3UE26_9RHOB|nr:hypothetical protein [Jannaschia faecimaris]SDZ60712.1 hypothetical protein SAMN05444004_1313 [Jannaschia faecimaris]
MASILSADVLTPEAEAQLEELIACINAELGPVITSFDSADSGSITIDENTTFVATIAAEDRYSLNGGAEALTHSIVGGADMTLFHID